MKRSLAIAAAAVLTLSTSVLFGTAPANAAAASFQNPLATPSTADLDISSVDIDVTTTTVTITSHVQNLPLASYRFQLLVSEKPGPFSESPTRYVAQTDVNNSATNMVIDSTENRIVGGVSTSTPATYTYSVSGTAHRFVVPRASFPWAGPLNVSVILATPPDKVVFAATAVPNGDTIGWNVATGPAARTLVLTASAPSQTIGAAPATVTATVGPAAAGFVRFSDGTAPLGAAAVSGGSASVTLPATLPIGAHAITAEFVPNDPIAQAPATSTIPFTVVGLPTTAKLSLSKSKQKVGGRSAKATVTVSGTKAGKVAFYDGAKKLKTVTVKKGKATYTLSKKLKKGTHKISAVFTPTDVATYVSSTSTTKTLIVKR